MTRPLLLTVLLASACHAPHGRESAAPAEPTPRAEATEVEALRDHLSAVWSLTGDAEASWGSALTLLLRDPDFLFY